MVLWSNLSILKEINPEYSLEGLMLKPKLQYFGHLIQRADSLEKALMLGQIEGRRRRGVTEDEMVGWHHRLNGREFEQTLGDGEGQGSLACAVHRVTKSWIQLSDTTTTTSMVLCVQWGTFAISGPCLLRARVSPDLWQPKTSPLSTSVWVLGQGWEEAPVKISRGKVVREPEVPWDLRASDSVSHQAPWALAFLAQLGVKYLEPSKCLLPHVFKSTGWFLNPQWASCSIPLPLCLILWPSLQAPSHDWTATIVALETSPEIRDICNN